MSFWTYRGAMLFCSIWLSESS